jgi:hypothetical protein
MELHEFEPMIYKPDPAHPLLVLSCSQTKAPSAGYIRFHDLYAGPLWQQVKASSFPLTNVAAISAMHGFLAPGSVIKTYDRMLDEKAAESFVSTSNHVWRFAMLAGAMPRTLVIGGRFYRQLPEAATSRYPSIAPKVAFAAGSFLQLRAELGRFLEPYRSAA